MHIHLSWLILTAIIIGSIILLLAIPTEQDKLNRTDIRADFKRKHNIK